MMRLKDIPLLLEELTDDSAAAISGGLSIGRLRPLSSLPLIGQGVNGFLNRGGNQTGTSGNETGTSGNETGTNSPEAFLLEVSEAKQLASEEKDLAKELVEIIEEEL
ncbi:hypothetical protein F7734_01500 [Scytonema sp. UIC 10036]|uniref:hypothetical protein n=1 Tax=Scytonema sp. UIC 10036 TaxID=2304196 RepID=UPI0012DAA4EA|nr:hypothetical protein [Scytonema sp. UIC 10036]MUG91237.1 hypothetical protein [Scytonema sp. UIC 10036]